MNSIEWTQGWDSYFSGLDDKENPYQKETEAWERWDDGWYDAAHIDTGGSRIC